MIEMAEKEKKKITYADLVAELEQLREERKTLIDIMGEMLKAFNVYCSIIEVYAKHAIDMLGRLEALEGKRKEDTKHDRTYHG